MKKNPPSVKKMDLHIQQQEAMLIFYHCRKVP